MKMKSSNFSVWLTQYSIVAYITLYSENSEANTSEFRENTRNVSLIIAVVPESCQSVYE